METNSLQGCDSYQPLGISEVSKINGADKPLRRDNYYLSRAGPCQDLSRSNSTMLNLLMNPNLSALC